MNRTPRPEQGRQGPNPGQRPGPGRPGGLRPQGPPPRTPSFKEILKRLWPYLRRYKKPGAFALLFTVTFTLLNIPNVHFLGFAIGTLGKIGASLVRIGQADSSMVQAMESALLFLAAIYLLRQGLATIRDYLMTRVNQSILRDVRSDIFSHLLTLSPDYFEGRLSGGILAKMLRDAGVINVFLSAVLIAPFVDILTFLAALAYALWLSPKLTLVFVGLMPVYVLLFRWSSRKLQVWSRRSRDEFEHMAGHLTERISGIQEIQLFGQENREQQTFTATLNRQRFVNVILSLWQGVVKGVAEFMSQIGPILVLGIGLYEMLHGRMDIDRLMQFYFILGIIYGPVTRFIDINSVYQTNLPSIGVVFDLLDTPPVVKDTPNAKPLTQCQGAVEFRDVGFAFTPGVPVLRGLNFSIQPGEYVGIVGPSGCGKTTAFRMLARFLNPGKGAVLLDGNNIQDYTIDSVRQSLALVTQHPLLFKASVLENIRYGSPDAPMEAVVQAARIAGIHDEIKSMQRGYDTEVGERGATLSGGQRQRVAIARAILRDASILLLDEATAALDTETEHEVQQALSQAAQGRTTLAIAHRLSTLSTCDRILVMDKGQIAEQGPHKDLLAQNGLYAKLWRQS